MKRRETKSGERSYTRQAGVDNTDRSDDPAGEIANIYDNIDAALAGRGERPLGNINGQRSGERGSIHTFVWNVNESPLPLV